MDYNEIRELLKKYWTAETDLSEEARMKDFFISNSNIPDDLLAEKHLFMTYHQDANYSELNEDLTARLRTHLSRQTVPFWRTAIRYAAVLLPLAVLSYFIFRESNADHTEVVQATITNKEEVVKEANTALVMLSVNMKDGLENVKQLDILKSIGSELNEISDQNKQK
jgi:hypothetical protein